MDLVRDLLDQAIVDSRGRAMGRVDGIVVELRQAAPPRVVSLAIGATALGERLHPAIGRWVKVVQSRLNIVGRHTGEIPIGDVVLEGATVRVKGSR
jgi:sporulation protein YlmC with PRC-barrel domain